MDQNAGILCVFLLRSRDFNICKCVCSSVACIQFQSIVLQLCPGGALNERIKNQTPSLLTSRQRLQTIVGTARALVHLHSINMIHRDVKTQVFVRLVLLIFLFVRAGGFFYLQLCGVWHVPAHGL